MQFAEKNIWRLAERLFPIWRSLSGSGNEETLAVLKSELLPDLQLKKVSSGSEVYDWTIPPEWQVRRAYIKNGAGEIIVDTVENNLHLVSYSMPISGVFSEEELRPHLYSIEAVPEVIPYRTSYYTEDWGFCIKHSLLSSEKFFGPFEVLIDSQLKTDGNLVFGECVKQGRVEDEILISTYFCHPSMANDNLSGVLVGSFLFNYLSGLDTHYSYRLAIVPETIGALAFMNQVDPEKIIGGTVLSCVGGPDKLSLKESFDASHWTNQAAHMAVSEATNGDYITYPFTPNGSDERQYSTPGFRINTPSIHKSKYYEFVEYHTSADNLSFVKEEYLLASLGVYIRWFELVDSYTFPKRINPHGEYQLGKRGLYPSIGGTLFQSEKSKPDFSGLSFNHDEVEFKMEHFRAAQWIMHMADGEHSNFDISRRSGIALNVVNQMIKAMLAKGLLNQ